MAKMDLREKAQLHEGVAAALCMAYLRPKIADYARPRRTCLMAKMDLREKATTQSPGCTRR